MARRVIILGANEYSDSGWHSPERLDTMVEYDLELQMWLFNGSATVFKQVKLDIGDGMGQHGVFVPTLAKMASQLWNEVVPLREGNERGNIAVASRSMQQMLPVQSGSKTCCATWPRRTFQRQRVLR